jgi:hypothetical protein
MNSLNQGMAKRTLGWFSAHGGVGGVWLMVNFPLIKSNLAISTSNF